MILKRIGEGRLIFNHIQKRYSNAIIPYTGACSSVFAFCICIEETLSFERETRSVNDIYQLLMLRKGYFSMLAYHLPEHFCFKQK